MSEQTDQTEAPAAPPARLVIHGRNKTERRREARYRELEHRIKQNQLAYKQLQLDHEKTERELRALVELMIEEDQLVDANGSSLKRPPPPDVLPVTGEPLPPVVAEAPAET